MALVQIDEVLGRSEQGITQPYICRSSEGQLYYVKGKGAGYPSLMKEWIAGELGLKFGLPMPPFTILWVPRELFEAGRSSGLADLGHGPVFASKALSNVNEISIIDIESMEISLKRDIAVFDWWILNGDRTLSINGGNPNILWSVASKSPFVIDHNLAFDPSVTLRSLEESHIFGSCLTTVKDSPDLQRQYVARFDACLSNWDEICRDIPERWHYIDDLQTVRTDFSSDGARRCLQRTGLSKLWK